MKYVHDYSSYRAPAPTIADAFQATEDVAGDLATTHTLVRSLMGSIEGMQRIAQQQKEAPGTVHPEAINSKLETLWALAEAIDHRMKDSIILLYAIIDADGGREPAQAA